MASILQKLIDPNVRQLARLERIVEQINALEPQIRAMKDEQLAAKTEEFKNRLAAGETLDDLMVEAFAVAREVARRTIGERPFDVQLMGAIVLHEGKIAEMKTGEGKTLAATMPIYLNALTGKGAHLVTVNPYLARRDANWMGPIYEFLGLSVGVVEHGQSREEKQAAYRADISYGTNSEFGFDYLRDNMALRQEDLVQRELNYAIVDEVDNIMIDEARTPLIISGIAAKPTELYIKIDKVVAGLKRETDFTIDEKARTAMLNEEGTQKVEKALGIDNLSDPENIELAHHVNAALRARYIYKRDVDYVVKNGQVLIVDEFTGRILPGRRFGEGLHQALEAKEAVRIERESQTVATITYQNYFRLYNKLAGMTGTAKTEEAEFIKIYGLPVVVIPTNEPMIRLDHPDVVYKTEEAKFRGIISEILTTHARGQPVLVGTRSIDISERLSARLAPDQLKTTVMTLLLQRKLRESNNSVPRENLEKFAEILSQPLDSLSVDKLRPIARALGVPPDPLDRHNLTEALRIESEDGEFWDSLERSLTEGIPHNVLNAKHHEKEAQIIAEAGQFGAVTIATNMAGRGVDIILGGSSGERDPEEWRAESEKVKARGGLHILGSERHESRRIDNQLRGRSGRQGDPGTSRFYLSLEDELWRLFGGERLGTFLKAWPEDEPIAHRLVTKGIENAQKKVESHHFEIRKNTLKYDDVMNTQRALIYDERRKILTGADLKSTFTEFTDKLVEDKLGKFANKQLHRDDWDLESVYNSLKIVYPLEERLSLEDLKAISRHEEIEEVLKSSLHQAYAEREAELGEELMRSIERMVLLQVIETRWIEHLEMMDDLREGVGLRAFAQIDPLVAYQKEAFGVFEELLASIREEAISMMFRVQVAKEPVKASYTVVSEAGTEEATTTKRPTRKGKKIGRNDPCPCGSGKKYKKCCLLKEQAA